MTKTNLFLQFKQDDFSEESFNNVTKVFRNNNIKKYLRETIPKMRKNETISVPENKKRELAELIYNNVDLGNEKTNWYTAELLFEVVKFDIEY
uniref:Uncharacterized protein n=1 Tax=viral metagenome TaxID=1070528 RepID=A0A6C0AD13_9ZZZZ